jgi:hypothetical protein
MYNIKDKHSSSVRLEGMTDEMIVTHADVSSSTAVINHDLKRLT